MLFARTLLSLLLVGVSALRAQSLAITPGTQVRVWSTAPAYLADYHARVAAFALDTLEIRGDAALLRVPVSSLRRVELNVPRSRGRGALRGAGIGALAGALMGAGVYGLAMANCRPGDDMCGLAVYYIPIGVLFAAPAGALVGAFSPGNRWQPLHLPLTSGGH